VVRQRLWRTLREPSISKLNRKKNVKRHNYSKKMYSSGDKRGSKYTDQVKWMSCIRNKQCPLKDFQNASIDSLLLSGHVWIVVVRLAFAVTDVLTIILQFLRIVSVKPWPVVSDTMKKSTKLNYFTPTVSYFNVTNHLRHLFIMADVWSTNQT